MTIYADNRQIIPTSGTVTLYKAGTTTVLQAATAVSIDATTGEMTYALTATHTATAGLNYKAVWAYVASGVTYYETQLFDVVKSILSIPITDDDLYNELESLRKANKQETGTSSAGAAGSITDTKRKEPTDYWKGGIIEIMAGTGVGQKRDVTGNTVTTGVITVTPDWVTNPGADSVYRIVKSFSNKIQHSFKKIETMLYDKGKRHELILESSQIEIPLLYMTVHFIALDLMDEANDKWSLLAIEYWKKFELAFGNLTLEYDEDESGAISGADEEKQSPGSLRISRC